MRRFKERLNTVAEKAVCIGTDGKAGASKAMTFAYGAAMDTAASAASAVANPSQTLHSTADSFPITVAAVKRAADATADAANHVAVGVVDAVHDPGTTARELSNRARLGLLDAAAAVGGAASTMAKEGTKAAVHTSRFFTDSTYRDEEALPAMKRALSGSADAIYIEMQESEEMAEVLYRYGQGDPTLTSAELINAKAQLTNLAKTVPALAIFALPGGAVLLPLMAKILPFELFPSNFGKRRVNCNPDPEYSMINYYRSQLVAINEEPSLILTYGSETMDHSQLDMSKASADLIFFLEKLTFDRSRRPPHVTMARTLWRLVIKHREIMLYLWQLHSEIRIVPAVHASRHRGRKQSASISSLFALLSEFAENKL